jgi:hypothetical protein
MSKEGEDNHERHQRVALRTSITPGKRRNAQEDPIEIFRREIAKHVVGTSSRLRRMVDWTLWRGWPPPKRKRRMHTE